MPYRWRSTSRAVGQAVACLIFFVGLSPVTAVGQDSSEQWQELARLLEGSPRPESVKAVFTQERVSLLLDEPVRSAGTFVAKGSTARLSLTKPEPVEMRFDPAAMQIYFPDDHLVEHYPIPRAGLAYVTGRLEADRLAADFHLLALDRDETDAVLTLRLEPREDLREHLRSLTMRFDVVCGLVVGVQMVDVAGDITDMALTEIQTDVEVSDADVSLRLPDDVVHVYPAGDLDDAGAP